MTLSELKKLAESADAACGHISNALAEKYPLGADFERHNDDIRAILKFFYECEVPDLIARLESAELALNFYQDEKNYINDKMNNGYGDTEVPHTDLVSCDYGRRARDHFKTWGEV